MKFIGVAGLALAALVSVGTPSSAATISNAAFNDGVDDIYGTASRGGYYGANLWLTGDAEISIAYLGAEAGYHNQFLWDNVLKFTTPGGQAWIPAAPAVSLGTVLAGLLNFSFLANGGSSGVSNGSNGSPGSNAPPNFFLSFDGIDAYATSGNSVVLWFDDNGSPDDNHDDMAIRISITGNGSGTLSTVPVPAAGFLLFGALGGLAAFKRRRRA